MIVRHPKATVIDAYARLGGVGAAEELGMTRTAVYNVIRAARKNGAEIEKKRVPASDQEVIDRLEVYGRLGRRGAMRALGIPDHVLECAIRTARRRGIPVPKCPPQVNRFIPPPGKKRTDAERAEIRRQNREQRQRVIAYIPPRFIDAHLAHELLCRALPRKSKAA